MNDAFRDKSLLVVVSCCLLIPAIACSVLLLPVVVTLFNTDGTSTRVSAASIVTLTPNVPGLSSTPTLATDQAIGNAANGKQLFNTFQPAAGISCSTCHRVDSEERLVGPGLLNVGIRAETRVTGLGVVDYLRQSIVQPSAYVVAGYPDIMPKNWGRVFSEQQLNDIIAYLLTLKRD